MFENCHGPREVAHIYSMRGFPVQVSFNRTSLVTTTALGAIAMPPMLGRATLQATGDTCTVPILTYARPGREWVFLIGAGRGRALGTRRIEALARHGVRILPLGSRVWLPMSDTPSGWYWVNAPQDVQSVPAIATVLHAVDTALTESRNHHNGSDLSR
ncbi:hypothetical protein [Nocardia fusca]|jgi:hypothetical protein|uniref:hypothetical protein n=1 Tax=Nocardia fusca TaxID=941183 RepID=UPI0007A73B12|nr:hypothetical protein [Nocardia fusca]